jgi:hypothetical protein
MDYTYQTPQTALEVLRETLGTWQKVAQHLNIFVNGQPNRARIWNMARRGTGDSEVEAALVEAGLIEPRPKQVSVEACMECGGPHTFHATCPTRKYRDTRKTRAWHGSEEEARELDRRLSDLGFRNMQHWVDKALLDGKWFEWDDA